MRSRQGGEIPRASRRPGVAGGARCDRPEQRLAVDITILKPAHDAAWKSSTKVVAAGCGSAWQHIQFERRISPIATSLPSSDLQPTAAAVFEGAEARPGVGQERLRDSFGRAITDLRISVTDRCNYKCVYCRTGNEGAQYTELPVSHYLRMVRILVGLGIEKVRLTGG